MKKTFLAVVSVIMTAGCSVLDQGGNVNLENLKQPPKNTTMMGVVKGVSDYYELGLDEPMIYGLSGHAFLINIHNGICPSGPYCWKREKMNPLFANMGLKVTDLGFFSAKTPEGKRAELESKIRESLDNGNPCSLINMENQIISGYDKKGFNTAQPWGGNFPPGKMSFGTWKELGKEIHINFYTFEKIKPADRKSAIIASLDYAVDLFKNPKNHTSKAYGAGPEAYDRWIKAVPKHGKGHGNWWNGVVWGECREMASKYFAQIGQENKEVSDLCSQLEKDYLKIGKNLRKISSKKLDQDEKLKVLKETKQLEVEAIDKVEKVVKKLKASK